MMAGIALHHPQASFAQQVDSAAMISPLYQRRGVQDAGHIELLPNPDFVFPARSPADSPSLENWSALNRRPRSAQQTPPAPFVPEAGAHRARGSVNLPNFSFNPSASTSESTSPSLVTPPHSPSLMAPATPSRGIGHKRGGSEFIGGDGMGGTGLLSTSPTKNEPVLPPPRPSGRLGPPGGGPGHRHRRSGAISCHDLQSILQPKDVNLQPRGGSAPVTPLESDQKQFFTPAQRRRTHSQADVKTSPERTTSTPPLPGTASPQRVVPRVRVGFADRVEYIRPLSTISSETEGSMSTIRGGHSLSGSISSVISAGATSPPSARMARPSLNTTFEDEDARQRPQSSGCVLESATKTKGDFHVDWEESVRPKSAVPSPANGSASEMASSPTSRTSGKRKSFSWWDSRRHNAGHLPSSVSEPSLLPSPPSSPSSPDYTFSGSDEASATDIEKSARKPRRVKHWAHSIISRKVKSHGNLNAKLVEDRAPTPPTFDDTLVSPNGEIFHFEADSFEPNFDIDDTVTIVSDSQPAVMVSASNIREHADSDALSPVIDLDAALGPFNTPPLGANTRNSPVRAPPRARRSMHSIGFHAGGYGSFLQNHRRTESAPELVPFESRTSKAAPSSTMPDVFEEEDEEEAAEMPSMDMMSSEPEEDDDANIGVCTQIVEADELKKNPEQYPSWPAQSGLGIQRHKDLPSPISISSSTTGATVSPMSDEYFTPREIPLLVHREPSPVEVVEDFEEPRASSLTRDSDTTVTPPLSADEAKNQQTLNFPLPLAQQPIMTPDTLSGCSFSSRAFNTSQASLSTPRLGSAASTGTTDNRSFTFGEPGPPLRMSVDDVPSLSSSRSTMTTPPQNPFATLGSNISDGRTSSVYSAPSVEDTRRGNKRASIASLSRLVGTTFGEKSKLSIESRPQSQHILSTTVNKKKKKTNRLSKLIHFWKKSDNSSPRP